MKQKLWFYNDWREQNLHRSKIPRIPDEQSAGFMHRPKIPKNPKIFRNYQARPWQSSKKSWDSWESWACAWILHFVHQESWESWACAGLVSFLHLWSHKTCTGPRFPRFLMNKVQDSCTGPRFPRIPRFLGTIRQDPGKVPKNLGILGNLGPVHESCTLFIRNLGNLGPVQVWWAFSIFEVTKPAQAQDSQDPDEQSAGFMNRPKIPKNPKIFRNYQARPWQSSKKSWDSWESWACAWILHFVHRDSWESWACSGFMNVLCQIMLFFEKMHFPCVFWWWTSELVQRVFIFWWNFWK